MSGLKGAAIAVGLILIGQSIAPAATPASILSQPKGGSALAGRDFSFDVLPGGDAPFTYQWFQDAIPLPNQTNLLLRLIRVGVAQTGAYSVAVSNATGGVLSTPASLLVSDPIIVTQPTNAAALAGDTVGFQVGAEGTGPLLYQWFLEGNRLAGQTNALLQITNAAAANRGNYTVGVSNRVTLNLTNIVVSGLISAPAQLTVVDPVIVRQPVSVGSAPRATVVFQVLPGGTAPFQYQWFHNDVLLNNETNAALVLPRASETNNGAYKVTVNNAFGSVTSSSATLLVGDPRVSSGPVGGSTNGGGSFTFQVVAEGTSPLSYQWHHKNVALPGATNATLTLSNLTAAQSGDYTVAVTNASGGLVSIPATLTVSDPVILIQPAGGAVKGGGMFTFAVSATGSSTLNYQWTREGVAVPGGTNSTLTVTNLSTAVAGGYAVIVRNLSGSVTSLVATLTVDDPFISRAPVGGTVAAGSNFTFSVVVAGSAPLSYRWLRGGAEIPGQSGASLLLTNVTLADAGNYAVQFSNSSGTISSAPVELVVVELKITRQPQGAWAASGEDFTNSVEVLGKNPISYQWSFRGLPLAGATNSTLRLVGVTTTNAGAYSVLVSNATGTVTSDTVYLVVFDPVIRAHPQGGSAALGAGFNFSVVAAGTGPLTYQWLFNGTELVGKTAATLALTGLTAGQAGNYSVRVSNGSGSIASRSAALTVVSLVFLTEPQDQVTVAGATVTNSVTVGGPGPFSYQWRFGGTALPGATGPTLVLTNVMAANGGSYSVVVSNATGSITSRDALLTVRDPIVLDPGVVGGYASVGEDFSFTVRAAGTQPMIYQWFFNGSVLEGEVTETLRRTDLTTADSGPYFVQVRNAAGVVTSEPGQLLVTTGTPRSVATGSYTSSGYRAELQILLEGNGTEKGLSFSLAFDPMIVANPTFVPSRPATHTLYTDPNFPDLVGVELDLTSGTFLRTNQQLVGTLFFDVMYDSDILLAAVEFVDGFIPTEARDAFDRSMALATELKPSGVLIDPVPVYDPLSGLFLQRLLLSNPVGAALTNVVVDVYGLGDDSLGREIFLYNGVVTGFTDPGRINRVNTVTDSVQLPLPPGALAVVTMEYFVSDRRTVPTPSYEFYFGSLVGRSLPGGTTMVNIVNARFLDGRFLIEFPTEANRDYYVQYSDKLGGDAVFTTSFPSVRGTGGTARWIDSGAPRTGDQVTNMRCYRVLRAP